MFYNIRPRLQKSAKDIHFCFLVFTISNGWKSFIALTPGDLPVDADLHSCHLTDILNISLLGLVAIHC